MTIHARHIAPIELRPDLELIASLIEPGSRVLDIGCGDGSLLAFLRETKDVDGRGIELERPLVNEAVRRGVPVIQGDADADLVHYPDAAFDVTVLSKTLQATRDTKGVLENLVRIGRRAIVSVPNFGHWRARWQLAVRGHMPVNRHMPYSWWDTPNIHFCTIADFHALTREVGARVEARHVLRGDGRPIGWRGTAGWTANLLGQQAVFVLRGGDGDASGARSRRPGGQSGYPHSAAPDTE